MQKILIPIDGSENALRAVKYAIGNVQHGAPAELHLLHVEAPMPTHVHAYFSINDLKKIEASVSEETLLPARQLCEDTATPYVTHIRSGAIAQTIAACAEEFQCNAIVMGTRGMNAIANLITGSVTTKVIHLANVPVTVLK